MKIGLIAIAGVKVMTRKFIDLGVTLPQFVNRGQVVAQLPSLALLTLAGATPDEADIDLEYIEVDDVDAFLQHPPDNFDLVALSTYTARALETYRVADAYRSLGTTVVIGGLHATVLPEEAAEHADAVVVGEAERTWPELVRDFRQQGRRGLRRVYREDRPGEFDLAESPLPRFDLLQGASSPTVGAPDETGELHRRSPYNRITIQSTRGCPLDCEFCAASRLYGPRYRRKPVDHVLREVDLVRSLWHRPFIELADDNTFVHKPWSKRLLRGLADRNVRYFTETDISVADDKELLDLLHPSGCRQVLIGLESPTRDGLVGIDSTGWKAKHFDRYFRAIDEIQSRGISVCGCFIVGLDTDTVAVFDDVREFVERSRLLEVQVTVLTPFPGTRLYRRLSDEGRLLYPGAWNRCTLFDVNFRPKRMSRDELEEGLVSLWRDIWSADAHAVRKQHYRDILRGPEFRKAAGVAVASTS